MTRTTDNSRADALTDTKTILDEALRLIFDAYSQPRDRWHTDHGYIVFLRSRLTDAFSFMQKAREALKMASPVEQHEAAPADTNSPIEELMDEYRNDGFNFADIERVKRCALRYVQTMPDSHVRTLLYTLASVSLEGTGNGADERAVEAVAIAEGFAFVPIERSYDMRVKAIIAFNTAEKAGQDRDDALDAAHRATIAAPPAQVATRHGLTDEQCDVLTRLANKLETGQCYNGIANDNAAIYAEAIRALLNHDGA